MMYVQVPLAVVLSLISIALAGSETVYDYVDTAITLFQEEVVRAEVAARRDMEKFGSKVAESLAD